MFLSICAQAQTKDLPESTLSVRVGITAPTIPLSLEPPASSNREPLLYEQNANSKFGIGADYKWMGFFVSVADVQSELSPETYGSTDYFDFQFHIYTKKWGFDLYAQDFQGYYLSNTQEVLGTECCEIREDIRSKFYGANVFYVFNPEKLSYVAAGNLTAQQISSGGSWSLYAGYGYQNFNTGSTLAPASLSTDYGVLGNIEGGAFQTFVVGGGYGYTGVIAGPFFFHISAQLGLGPQYQKFSTADFGNYDQLKSAGKATGRFALGWSGEQNFGAVQITADNTSFQLGEELISFNSVLAFTSFGWRFDI